MAPININDSDGDWLVSLARQSAYAESNAKSSTSSGARNNNHAGTDKKRSSAAGCDSGNSIGAMTKTQRIARRDQKRIQREDRKRLAEVARQQRISKKRRMNNAGSGGEKRIPASAAQSLVEATPGRAERNVKRSMTTKSKQVLARLITILDSTVSSHDRTNSASRIINRPPKRKHHDDTTTTSLQQQIINGVPAEPKGKATKTSTLRPESKELQPRVRDYNGQGLVRPSLYIPFNDPSFKPKVELEFEEHIPGFFGKAKQKAAKKQSDQNMLWKRCLQAKQTAEDSVSAGSNKQRKGKKGAGVNDRVDGLMRRGIM